MKSNFFIINLAVTVFLLIVLVACQPTSSQNDQTSHFEIDISANSEIKRIPTAKVLPIKGVDISKYQGTVDFDKLKSSGIYYIFIRATEGITYQDPDYITNYTQAKSAGLRVGVYHFYESNDDPDAQLKNFTSLVTLGTGDLAPVIDIEKLHQQDDVDLIKNLRSFLAGLEALYAIKPIVYTGENFANKYLSTLGDYPLWLAEYEVDEPKVPVGWKDWTFWQWSQSETVDGISGTVDVDLFNGDQAHFGKLLIK